MMSNMNAADLTELETGDELTVEYESAYGGENTVTGEITDVEHNTPEYMDGETFEISIRVPDGDDRRRDIYQDGAANRRVGVIVRDGRMSVTLETKNGGRWNRLSASGTDATLMTEVSTDGEGEGADILGEYVNTSSGEDVTAATVIGGNVVLRTEDREYKMELGTFRMNVDAGLYEPREDSEDDPEVMTDGGEDLTDDLTDLSEGDRARFQFGDTERVGEVTHIARGGGGFRAELITAVGFHSDSGEYTSIQRRHDGWTADSEDTDIRGEDLTGVERVEVETDGGVDSEPASAMETLRSELGASSDEYPDEPQEISDDDVFQYVRHDATNADGELIIRFRADRSGDSVTFSASDSSLFRDYYSPTDILTEYYGLTEGVSAALDLFADAVDARTVPDARVGVMYVDGDSGRVSGVKFLTGFFEFGSSVDADVLEQDMIEAANPTQEDSEPEVMTDGGVDDSILADMAPGPAESEYHRLDDSREELESVMKSLGIDRRTAIPEQDGVERDLRLAHQRMTDAMETLGDHVESAWGRRP